MAISPKQKQKKLEKKNKKRTLVKKTLRETLLSKNKASTYAECPVHECLVSNILFDQGLGTVIVTRHTPDGMFAISAFVVDIYCMGVKNAFFYVASEYEYEDDFKPRVIASHEDQQLEKVHIACAKKLIEGAVDYAKELGFSPHSDYPKAKDIFGDIDVEACPVKYEYGREGRPFYIRGPNESLARARGIVNQLDRKCGEGNYGYLVGLEAPYEE